MWRGCQCGRLVVPRVLLLLLRCSVETRSRRRWKMTILLLLALPLQCRWRRDPLDLQQPSGTHLPNFSSPAGIDPSPSQYNQCNHRKEKSTDKEVRDDEGSDQTTAHCLFVVLLSPVTRGVVRVVAVAVCGDACECYPDCDNWRSVSL